MAIDRSDSSIVFFDYQFRIGNRYAWVMTWTQVLCRGRRLSFQCWLAPLLGVSLEAAPGKEPSAALRSGGGHDSVVLLHGLGRTALSMKRIEWALENEGFRVINVSYPSTRLSVQGAAQWLRELLRQRITDQTATVHFVTHSLGGIILRQSHSDHPIQNLGRVVMLAPPNQGSQLADRLKNNRLFRTLTGPAGQQLGTGADSVPSQLGPADFQLGIIAGDRSLNPWLSRWIPGPDDGKVSVEATRLKGTRDFLLVHRTHTWMMWRHDVIRAVAEFLRHGSFR